MTERKPAEIARDALKLIAERKQSPTPENYLACYNEVAGIHAPIATITSANTVGSWRPIAARIIESVRPALGKDDEQFALHTKNILAVLKQKDLDDEHVCHHLTQYNLQISMQGEEQGAIRDMVLYLFSLLLENIAALSVEDKWLSGQMASLMQVMQPPINLKRLDELKNKLGEVISKQAQAKNMAMQAQARVKVMLSTFIERMSDMSQNTGHFRDEIGGFASIVENAQDLSEIGPALQQVLSATREMESSAQQVGDELSQIRERAMLAEDEILKLQGELDRATAQAKMDPLTGALNRRGLDEAFTRDIASTRKKGHSLCLAMIDIDNFKSLNDHHGHDAGDSALSHLVDVARNSVRPHDSVARYGGEEFIILLPGASLDQAVEATQRIQRELTKHLFLQNSQQLLITFSAGVAMLANEELPEEAIKRADHAMYLAKRAGKNRVFAAS